MTGNILKKIQPVMPNLKINKVSYFSEFGQENHGHTQKTRRKISKPDMAVMRMRNRRRPLGFVTWNFFEFFRCELVHGWRVPRSFCSFPPGITLAEGSPTG